MRNFLLLASILLLAGCTFVPEETNDSLIEVEVLTVIDGDTIKIDYEGAERNVRYLLIDTPETNDPQPLGQEATKANREMLESGTVSIEFDEGDRYDDYDRLLAYVYVDGQSVQKRLLEQGLARVAYVFPPNTRYIEQFEEAEQTARDDGLGVWEFDGYVTNRGFNTDAYAGAQEQVNDSSGECTIKGNISRSGNRIFHLPGGPSYEETNPEQWFCTEQEARDAGFRGIGE